MVAGEFVQMVAGFTGYPDWRDVARSLSCLEGFIPGAVRFADYLYLVGLVEAVICMGRTDFCLDCCRSCGDD